MKSLNTNLHFQYENFAQEKTMVLVGSLGADLSMWDAQIKYLSTEFNILRLDPAGLGRSPLDKTVLSIADHGHDLFMILDALDLDKVYFCGLSLGGLIGQWLAIYHPERFEKIILCNTAAKIGTTETWNDRIETVKQHGLAAIKEATASKWFTKEFLQANAEVVDDIMGTFQRTDLNGYLANCAAVRDADFRDHIKEIKVPVLIISGSADTVTTPADAEFLAQEIPVNKHVSLQSAHLSNIACAEEFASLILDFCAD